MSGAMALTYTLRYQDQASSGASAALRALERGLAGVRDAASSASKGARDVQAGMAGVQASASAGATAARTAERALAGVGDAASSASKGARDVQAGMAGVQASAGAGAAAVKAAERAMVGVKDAAGGAAAGAHAVQTGMTGAQAAATAASGALRDVQGRFLGAGAAAAAAATEIGRFGSPATGAGLDRVAQKANVITAALQRMQGAASAGMRALQVMGQGIAAFQGVKFALGQPVRQTMGYDRRLANLANTAFAEESPAVRIAKTKELDANIMGAVRFGGGTREAALTTLESMVASGSKLEAAYGDLPTVMKFATAANADPEQLSKLITKAMAFGVKDRTAAGDMALRAGNLGGFELRDMQKHMPEQMAIASTLGMRGEAGYRALLVANQAAMLTTSNPDTAGNNLLNFLGKINAADTGVKAKGMDINLSGSLAKAAGKGVNGLDAFVNLVEQLVAKDAKFQALRKKAASATGEEQSAAYEAQLSILKGYVYGKIVEDRQAMMGLLGVLQQKASGDTDRMREQLRNSAGTGDAAFSVVAQTASFKVEQAAQERDAAMQRAMDKVNPALGDLADKATDLARRFPDLASATWAATAALTALASASGLSTLAGKLLGGGGTGAAAARVATGLAGGGTVAAGTAAVLGAGALAAGAGIGTALYNAGRGTKLGDGFGTFALEVGAFFGSKGAREDLNVIRQLEASAVAQQDTAKRLADLAAGVSSLAAGVSQRAPLVVQLDGRQIYSSVDDIATEQARRR